MPLHVFLTVIFHITLPKSSSLLGLQRDGVVNQPLELSYLMPFWLSLPKDCFFRLCERLQRGMVVATGTLEVEYAFFFGGKKLYSIESGRLYDIEAEHYLHRRRILKTVPQQIVSLKL